MENQQELSPEELAERKEEMLKFYTESMPYLKAQYEYEKALSEIDEIRFKRAQIQMQFGMMMSEPEEEPQQEAPKAPKKRVLRKEEA